MFSILQTRSKPAMDRAIRITLAAYEQTPSDLLIQLAKDEDSEIRLAVASNPATPQDVLLKLGKEFPDAIVSNPIFNILLLENPESRFVRLSLARSSMTSAETLANLAQMPDEEVLCAIAQNPNTPVALLEQLIQSPPQIYDYDDPDGAEYDRLFTCIARNPNMPASLLIQLAEQSRSSVRCAIAENPNVPVELLDRFADRNDLELRKAILRNPHTPTSVLEKLSTVWLPEIRRALKQHPNATEKITGIIDVLEKKRGILDHVLDSVATDQRFTVRYAVINYLTSFKRSLQPEIFEELIRATVQDFNRGDQFQSGQKCLLERWFCHLIKYFQFYKLSPLAISYLAETESKSVKIAVMRLEKIPDSVWLKIIDYIPRSTLKELRQRSDLSIEIQQKILERVLLFSLVHINLDGISVIDYESLRNAISFKPGISRDTLTFLANHPHPSVRSAVAENPTTLLPYLSIFASDPNPIVRIGVARNRNVPEILFDRLLSDEDPEVRAAFAGNSQVPISVLRILAEDVDERVRIQAQKTLAEIL